MKRPELILFAKQPIPGQVKTRLQAGMPPAQAAAVAAFMIHKTAELAVRNWPGDVYLCATPDTEHPQFQELARTMRLLLAPQTTGDLGQRMRAALMQGIARRGAAAVMGCDVPQCRGDMLEVAHEQLACGRNVLGPTMDGGYYLIGLQRDVPELFDDMAWGSDQVLDATLARAARAGIGFEMLPLLRDVDTVADLAAVAGECPGLEGFVPQSVAGRNGLINKPHG